MSSKVESLLKKATTFEKLALYGDRKAFLTVLSQDYRAEVSLYKTLDAQVKQLSEAISNWISISGEHQPELPSLMKGLPTSLANWSQVIVAVARDGVDAGNLKQVYNAARQLAAKSNWGGMGSDAQQAWVSNVFPLASQLIDTAGQALQNLPSGAPESSESPSIEKSTVQSPVKNTPKRDLVGWTNQLVNTLNLFSGRATRMTEDQKAAALRQLNSTTLAELVNIQQQLGGSNNPYASPQEQQLAQSIDTAVRNFTNAFSSQITEAPNVSKLQTT